MLYAHGTFKNYSCKTNFLNFLLKSILQALVCVIVKFNYIPFRSCHFLSFAMWIFFNNVCSNIEASQYSDNLWCIYLNRCWFTLIIRKTLFMFKRCLRFKIVQEKAKGHESQLDGRAEVKWPNNQDAEAFCKYKIKFSKALVCLCVYVKKLVLPFNTYKAFVSFFSSVHYLSSVNTHYIPQRAAGLAFRLISFRNSVLRL